MFGTREPKLQPLNNDLRRWADEIMRAVSPERLRSEVERLPAPRNRLHSPDAMEQADQLIAQVFNDSGWSVEQRPFKLENVVGFLDHGAGLLPAGVIPEFYPQLAGTNIIARKEGASSKDMV